MSIPQCVTGKVSHLNAHCSQRLNVGVECLHSLTFLHRCTLTPTGGNQRSRKKAALSVCLSHSWITAFSGKPLSRRL